MPSLGADMEAGTVVEWRVAPGDTVHHGDIVAVVDTEKSSIEVEVFEDGVVEELLVEPGNEVPVGTPLARIRGAEVPPAARAPATEPPPPTVVAPVVAAAPRTHSPLVRHLAEHEHVDLERVKGSGPGGGITRADVEAAAGGAAASMPTTTTSLEPTAPSAEVTRVRASPLARRRVADRGVRLESVSGTGPHGTVVAADVERAVVTPRATGREARRAALGALMARSKREIPHYYLSTTVDMQAALNWLTETNESRPVDQRVLPAALLLHSTALASRDNPTLNGHWIDGAFRPNDAVHLGVAISLRGGGLIAPAIRDAQGLSVDELMSRLKGLVMRARAGSLRSSEVSDQTITVTNLGERGVETVFGVIHPPQVAMVGFGKIVQRPWVHEGTLCVRPVVTATLAADHRASDGHEGARFLAEITHRLEHPELA